MFSENSLSKKVQLIAHRGCHASEPSAPENSIQSLINAQKLNVYGAEFDVRMTKDKVLIVCHDEHHNGIEVSETEFSTLTSTLLSNGEHLPSLENYLNQGNLEPSLQLILELKPAKTVEIETEIVSRTLKLIDQMEMNNQIEFISFSLHICKEIKRLFPHFNVQYLNGDLSPSEVKALGFDGVDYHYQVFLDHPEWLSEAKSIGLVTNAWTVNDPTIFLYLKGFGIDFITTDLPYLFLSLNNECSAKKKEL